MRRVTLVNRSDRLREIEVTSLVEVVLARPAEDFAHPAFLKLFLETEYRPECSALLCGRRPRSPDEPTLWAVHVLSAEGGVHGAIEWETDRARFLGRGRTPEDPIALDGRALSGTTGAVLDPVLSLRQRVRIAPGGQVRLAFATGVATSRAAALVLADKYDDPASAARTFALAATQTQMRLRHLGLSADEAQLYEQLASRVLWTNASLRAAPGFLAGNTLGQSGLWAQGISGDLPILIVRVVEEDDVSLVRRVLRAQEYWRLKGLDADVVILNEHPASYLDEMHEQLQGLLESGPWAAWKHRPGGVFLLRGEGTPEAERRLLLAAARAVLSGERGGLAEQLDLPYPEPRWPGALAGRAGHGPGTTPPPDTGPEVEAPPLSLFNELGGFTAGGREYAIVLNGRDDTPLPWVNVIANERFGTVVGATGAAWTWAGNSRENRLTPFGNDPVGEFGGEALYLRDEEDGETWGATPGPLPRPADGGRWVTRHGAGVTRFAHGDHGVVCELAIFVHVQEPLRFTLLTLTNRTDRPRSPQSSSPTTNGRCARRAPANTASRSPSRTSRPAPSWRATPTTRTSPDASPSRTRARGRRRRPPTGSSSSAATARCGVPPHWPAKLCRIASARGSTPARRCSAAWISSPARRARWRCCSARGTTAGTRWSWRAASAASRPRAPRWPRSSGTGTSCSVPSRSRLRTTPST